MAVFVLDKRKKPLMIQITGTVIQGISHKACRWLQRADGYGYAVATPNRKESAFLPGVNADVSNARRG